MTAWDWSRSIFDHVQLRVSDLAASRAFYDTVLAPLGIPRMLDSTDAVQWANFAVSHGGGPLTESLHVAFMAPSREAVDAFHAAGLAAGYRDNGAPGVRQYGPPAMTYYAAYVLDPDGHNVEAVHRSAAAPR
jgi:catechol 2,3-dioxygenase-like lactoylglutathione lyase family enzyme